MEPYLLHAKLGIVHRASDTFRDKKSARVYTTDGESIVCNLKYKEGAYGLVVESAEPEKLSDWQERGGKKF